MLSSKHLALLAFLNDGGRSDFLELSQRLQRLSLEEVTTLLDEALDHIKQPGLVRDQDSVLHLILKESSESSRLSQYCRAIDDYLSKDVKVLTYWDPAYPDKLRDIPKSPLVVYVMGSVFPGDSPIAIAGTRDASPRGLRLSHNFARFFAERGRMVVSGLARGIDSAAHRGALEGGGSTLAILAGHVNYIYPKENRDLARAIIEHGALLSEITDQARMHKGRFVERNRITSGISDAVVIVECSKRGGTLHQARFALGQGRPTFVVDQGRFQRSEAEEGFRRLVNIGANPIVSPEDVPPL